MNVRDLIEELQKLPPHLPVKVVLSGFWVPPDIGRGEPHYFLLNRNDADEADVVRYEGTYALIEGR